MNLYRAVDVWKRENSGGVVRYRCFQSLNTGMYCVQSSDVYRVPTGAVALQKFDLDKQFVELLIEQDPFQRAGGGHKTLELAIAAHERDFKDFDVK
jgi:hypothetical protein